MRGLGDETRAVDRHASRFPILHGCVRLGRLPQATCGDMPPSSGQAHRPSPRSHGPGFPLVLQVSSVAWVEPRHGHPGLAVPSVRVSGCLCAGRAQQQGILCHTHVPGALCLRGRSHWGTSGWPVGRSCREHWRAGWVVSVNSAVRCAQSTCGHVRKPPGGCRSASRPTGEARDPASPPLHQRLRLPLF